MKKGSRPVSRPFNRIGRKTQKSGIRNTSIVRSTKPTRINGLGDTIKLEFNEFLGSVTQATANVSETWWYSLNPGYEATFAWLSSIAACYEQYRILDCCVEYERVCKPTDGGPMIISVDYDSDDVKGYNERALLQNRTSIAGSISNEKILLRFDREAMNTPGPWKFTRGVNSDTHIHLDKKVSDFGTLYLQFNNTTSNGDQGKLWLRGSVEFRIPKPPIDEAGAESVIIEADIVTNQSNIGCSDQVRDQSPVGPIDAFTKADILTTPTRGIAIKTPSGETPTLPFVLHLANDGIQLVAEFVKKQTKPYLIELSEMMSRSGTTAFTPISLNYNASKVNPFNPFNMFQPEPYASAADSVLVQGSTSTHPSGHQGFVVEKGEPGDVFTFNNQTTGTKSTSTRLLSISPYPEVYPRLDL